ncbi:MAG: DUF3750 domain-containing protein [Rhodospirillales bacterium]|nr:DUF3750 domain-containing protein [Alphaproteobacteria bacterium]MBL6947303.1 DUF3750 domain-containing protein [Rhodospirillales bacterium]
MRLWLVIPLALVLLGAIISFGRHSVMADWRTANRESAGIAPDPAMTSEAVVQVYIARAFSWRGWFGVHTWIATKPTGAENFTVYQIVGWRAYHGDGTALVIGESLPDRRWFGAEPQVISDLRGPGVDDVIRSIDAAAHRYPYAKDYVLWPGPNSNTFTAYIGREVPELKLDLPPTAIGKDFLTNGSIFDASPSRTGYQVSLYGLLGVLAGVEEGLEVNVLGLTFGVDPKDFAIKLPMAGRIGFQEN